MTMNRRTLGAAFVAVAVIAVIAAAPVAQAAIIIPVTDWVVHNGTVTDSDDLATNSPQFTPAETGTVTVMAGFPSITLAQDGDYLKLTTTLSMFGRTTTGVNTLNNNLRFGLFQGPDGNVVAEDTPNLGILAVYANSNQNHLRVFEQLNAGQVDPFLGITLIGPGVADPEDDSIEGVDPTAYYEMTLTRVGGELRIEGEISGGDYFSTYDISGHSSATFPTGEAFTFNRVGFYLGNNVNAADGVIFADVLVETNVPEPGTCVLAMTLAACLAMGRRPRRRA